MSPYHSTRPNMSTDFVVLMLYTFERKSIYDTDLVHSARTLFLKAIWCLTNHFNNKPLCAFCRVCRFFIHHYSLWREVVLWGPDFFTFNISNATAAPSKIFSVPKISNHSEMASANTVPATKLISKLLTMLMNYRIDFWRPDDSIQNERRDPWGPFY